jgi:CBS domain containing-hemolysin-like protein
MDSLTPLIIIAALIFANGLFVAAEFAIVGAPRTAIYRRAAAGSRWARQVRHVLEHPIRQDRFIATAQLGITFASLGLGMYGEHVVATWIAGALEDLGAARWVAAHTVASGLAVAILTYFHIVFGEMVPKSVALQQAERAALVITPPLRALTALLFPLVYVLNGLGNLVLRLAGIRRQIVTADRYYTPEELDFVVRESQEGGALRAEAGRMLRELLEFGELTAGEVMVPRVRVAGIPVGTTPDELREIMRASRHTRYPIYEADLDHIIGTMHLKDLVRVLRSGESIRAGHARPVPLVPETAPLDRLLATLTAARTQMAVVIDEHGGTAGLITLEDLFEEVIGEIEETPGGEPRLHREADGRIHVHGVVRIGELGDFLERELEHEEVDSVGGLILTLLGRPPVPGDTVVYEGLRFEVTEVAGHGVEECVVTET